MTWKRKKGRRCALFISAFYKELQDFQQLNFKSQRTERWDGRASTTFAISQVMRDIQLPLRTDWHQGQGFDPTSNNTVDREFSRLATLHGAVKHGTVNQFTGVVNAHAVLAARDRAFALSDHGELQTRFSAGDAITLCVGGQELLAFHCECFLTLTAHCISTFVNFTQCAVYHINRNCWRIPFQRIA